jgi:hypothetical protein
MSSTFLSVPIIPFSVSTLLRPLTLATIAKVISKTNLVLLATLAQSHIYALRLVVVIRLTKRNALAVILVATVDTFQHFKLLSRVS